MNSSKSRGTTTSFATSVDVAGIIDLFAAKSAPEEQDSLHGGVWSGLEILLIIMWALLLILIFFNAYNFLYKMTKYKFAPMVMVYVGNVAIAGLIIAYFSERLDANSRVQTSESAWIYWQANIRLACLIAIVGYIGLLIELRLMLAAFSEFYET